MKTSISVIGYKLLECSMAEALAFIQDLKHITAYEPKISEAQVDVRDTMQGEYATFGFFSCVPWRGKFKYVLNEHGFHSYMTEGWLKNCMQGGFVVLPYSDGQCQLWHYEEYRFPRAAITFRPGLRIYLERAMHRELHDIESLMCANLCHNDRLFQGSTNSQVAVVNHTLLPNVVSEVTFRDLFEGDPSLGADVKTMKMKALNELSVDLSEAKRTCCF